MLKSYDLRLTKQRKKRGQKRHRSPAVQVSTDSSSTAVQVYSDSSFIMPRNSTAIWSVEEEHVLLNAVKQYRLSCPVGTLNWDTVFRTYKTNGGLAPTETVVQRYFRKFQNMKNKNEWDQSMYGSITQYFPRESSNFLRQSASVRAQGLRGLSGAHQPVLSEEAINNHVEIAELVEQCSDIIHDLIGKDLLSAAEARYAFTMTHSTDYPVPMIGLIYISTDMLKASYIRQLMLHGV